MLDSRSFLRFGFVAIFLATASWSAPDTGYPKTPKEVMAGFLRLDADAAAIVPETWPELGRYTTWPAYIPYKKLIVIERYEIGRIQQGSTRALITVTYHPIGVLSDKFEENTAGETVGYHLNKVDGEWRVDSPQLAPHVLFNVMRQRLDKASAASAKVKPTNDALITQIETARQHVK
jgi:hypothetical protein